MQTLSPQQTRGNRRRQLQSPRRGAMLVLVAVIILAMLTVSAYMINTAYIELTRIQLRCAADAVAKSAVTALSQTQSTTTARTTAQNLAAQNKIGGSTYSMATSDIVFGLSVRQANGTYNFTANGTPTNSAQVTARKAAGSSAGSTGILFPGLLTTQTFDVTESATAIRADNDICVVVDRSGSMAWDLSNQTYSYPPALAGLSLLQAYFTPPDPTLSRWASLTSAVTVFQSTLTSQTYSAHVALVSYSSNYTFGSFNSVVSSIDLPLTSSVSSLTTALNVIGAKPVIGDTDIGAGMTAGIGVLTNPATTRVTAFKTMIVLTDGLKTQGADPAALATQAWGSLITVHAITFGANADNVLMQQVATNGHGNFYYAPTGAALTAAFQKIALSLPTVLSH